MYYNTKPLITALDSFIESAHDRLNNEELQLLASIRTGIAEAKNGSMIEDHFFRIVEFLLLIHEFFDKTS